MRARNDSVMGMINSLSGDLSYQGNISSFSNIAHRALANLTKENIRKLFSNSSFVGFFCNKEMFGNSDCFQLIYKDNEIRATNNQIKAAIKQAFKEKHNGIIYSELNMNELTMYPVRFTMLNITYELTMLSPTDPDYTDTIFLLKEVGSE